MIYKQNQVNLHTHSVMCGHGSGELKEFVEFAQEKKQLKVLGFSEHCPTPFKMLPSRMSYDSLPIYIDKVRELKETTKDIKILLGAECDWDKEYLSFYKDELLGKENFDYLIGSIHFMIDPDTEELDFVGRIKNGYKILSKYTKNYIQMLESGIFRCGCHPDVITANMPIWTEDVKQASLDIIQAAKDLDIPLEVNGYGFRKPMLETPNGPRFAYPAKDFWEMAVEQGVKICFNLDAHHVKHLEPDKNVQPFVDELGIKFIDWEFN